MGFLLAAVFWILLIFWAERGWGPPRISRAERRRLHLQNTMDRLDHELWELLHEDDPGWLAFMGISEPPYRKRWREETERLNRQEEAGTVGL